MKTARCYLALLLAPVCASAAITVTHYTGLDNLPVELVPNEIHLENVAADPSYPSASIRNVFHHSFYDECFGDSQIGFMRFRYDNDVCAYFFRSSNRDAQDPINSGYNAIENWGRVYWMENNQLVDGAVWGSDNYVMMRDLERDSIIAVLQFNFDEATGIASLVSSALDLNGLSYTQGVNAITGVAIPEPSSFATLAAATALGLATTARRRRRA